MQGEPLDLDETAPTGHGRARGLVSSRTSGRRIDAHTYAPPADLQDLIECFWCGEWDLPAQAPHQTLLLSDPCVHFVFERGGPHHGARVVGVWTRLWRRTLEGQGRVRAVKLRPGALPAFSPRRASELQNRIRPLAELFGPEVVSLQTQVLSSDPAAAFSQLADWLRGHLRPQARAQARTACSLAQRIADDPELTNVEQLAHQAKMNVRALQRLFRESLGASPKWVIRRNRLQEVALRLERGEVDSLAQLALQLGYTDQAHLSRDFKAAVGKTPRQFMASVGVD